MSDTNVPAPATGPTDAEVDRWEQGAKHGERVGWSGDHGIVLALIAALRGSRRAEAYWRTEFEVQDDARKKLERENERLRGDQRRNLDGRCKCGGPSCF